MNTQYGTLLETVGEITGVVATIQKDQDAISKFTGFLEQNETEISKFGNVTKEVCDYLDNYDFAHGYQFEMIANELESLHPLRLKLVKMGEEARKMSQYPDRYNSKKSIETCKQLAVVCMEKMSLKEIDKVSGLVESNTRKLIEIQKLFEKENNVLNQIHAVINEEKQLLQKYRAYHAELMQYVAEFPHEKQDDLSVVKHRIVLAKQIDTSVGKAEKALAFVAKSVDNISLFPEIIRYQGILSNVCTSMRTTEVDKYLLEMDEIVKGCATLYKMNETVKKNATIVSSFKAYYSELVQYVHSYPNSGQDNMAVVDNRISVAKKMSSSLETAKKAITKIKDYCDRYNKNNVITFYQGIVKSVITSMRFNDVGHYESQLSNLSHEIQSVWDAFEKEHKELDSLNNELKQRISSIWKEDNERLLYTVTKLLNNGTQQCDFSLPQLRTTFSDAKLKHTEDIDRTKKENKWLETHNRYKKEHEKLMSRYITSDDYHMLVGILKKDRIKRKILICIPVIGWIILLFFTDDVSL